MAEDVVYIGQYNNTLNYRLEGPPGTPLELSNITRIVANINGITINSLNSAGHKILWDKSGYSTGEIRCEFGAVPGLREGRANINFIAFDSDNASGLVFSAVPIRIEKLL